MIKCIKCLSIFYHLSIPGKTKMTAKPAGSTSEKPPKKVGSTRSALLGEAKQSGNICMPHDNDEASALTNERHLFVAAGTATKLVHYNMNVYCICSLDEYKVYRRPLALNLPVFALRDRRSLPQRMEHKHTRLAKPLLIARPSMTLAMS